MAGLTSCQRCASFGEEGENCLGDHRSRRSPWSGRPSASHCLLIFPLRAPARVGCECVATWPKAIRREDGAGTALPGQLCGLDIALFSRVDKARVVHVNHMSLKPQKGV